MDESPYSPWRAVDPSRSAFADEANPNGPLTGVLAACASLYRELIKAGINPLQADEMELWQIASLLGIDADDPGHPAAPAQQAASHQSASDALLRERVRRSREGQKIDESELESYSAESLSSFTPVFSGGE